MLSFLYLGQHCGDQKCGMSVVLRCPQIIYTKSPFFKKISLKQKFAYKISEQFKLYNFDKTSDVLITENKDVSKEAFFEIAT